jgi:hypothetical protein
MAMLVALHIRRVIGPVYKSAMTWTAVALGALAVATLQELVAKIYFLDTDYVLMQYSLLWFLLVGVLFLRAGVAFKETGRETVHLPADASHVDVVIGAAQLVSKFSDIDESLDDVRMITARQGQSTELAPADKDKLFDLYLYIENYLSTKEALHKFTKEGLRSGLPETFTQELLVYEQAGQKI